MADWSTIASLATAGGTLVLAIATFGSTRSANRAARASEEAPAPTIIKPSNTIPQPATPKTIAKTACKRWARASRGVAS